MSEKTQAEVVDVLGNFIRAYTIKDHGKNFEALAKEFATKNGYIVKGDRETELKAKEKNAEIILDDIVKKEKAKLRKEREEGEAELADKKAFKARTHNRKTKTVKK